MVYRPAKPFSLAIRSIWSSASSTEYTFGRSRYEAFSAAKSVDLGPLVGHDLELSRDVRLVEQLTRCRIAGEHTVGVGERTLDIAVVVRLDDDTDAVGRARRR